MRKVLRGIGNFFKRMSIKQRVAFGSGIVVLAIVLAVGGFILHMRNQVHWDLKSNPLSEPGVNLEKVEVPPPLYSEQKGITNILLIGTDARTLNERSRSDSIIIATIDDNTKKVRFTSIMRDSYVDIPNHGTQKINAAYAFGGPELLTKTIELNFKIKLDKFIIINFWGFEDVINAVGGIDVDIKQKDISEINKYIGETDAVKSPPLTMSGYQHLDGQQALAYSRIRHTDTEYARTGRQRQVLQLLIEKMQAMSATEYPKLMDPMLKCVKTNLEPTELLNLAYTVYQMRPIQIEDLQIPVDQISWGGMYNGAWYLLMDRDQNAQVMNDFIFSDKELDVKNLNIKAFQSVLSDYKKAEKTKTPAVTPEGTKDPATADANQGSTGQNPSTGEANTTPQNPSTGEANTTPKNPSTGEANTNTK
ncbi:MAG: LCP family protein [Bacillota bacterium]|nr:LCP family protein [Bacillota bacterium]